VRLKERFEEVRRGGQTKTKKKKKKIKKGKKGRRAKGTRSRGVACRNKSLV
jgi:hypothetical protein